MSRNSALLVLSLLIAVVVSGCSTTRRLADDETLYDGIKKLEITSPEGTKLDPDVATVVESALSVAPNNSFMGSAKMRTPFPIGLWVYNNWDPNATGLKGWLYRKLADDPILIENIRPAQRAKMAENLLDNNGYFRGTVTYDTIRGRNPKKAKISYFVNTGPEYSIKSVALLPDVSFLNHKIDSVAARHRYLKPGRRYSVDSLVQVRTDIANAVRNYGFYYFRPAHLEYLADSTGGNNEIALKLVFAKNIPAADTTCYYVGDVNMFISRQYVRRGTVEAYDTIATRRGTVYQMERTKFRTGLMDDCVTLRRGRQFSVRSLNRTQTNFSRLGIFSSLAFDVSPDTTASRPTLNVDITAKMATSLEGTTEANIVSKSNSFLGPGITLGATNRNLFGGGEQLSIKLTGTYEWQTGHRTGKAELINAYEFGASASLSFPRLLAPLFVPRSRRSLNWTKISLSANLLNRPDLFRMAKFDASFGYDWQSSRYASNKLELARLSYVKLLNWTDEFADFLFLNLGMADSFRDRFIPRMTYTYTYDRSFGRWRKYNWTISVEEAGNLYYGVIKAFGAKRQVHLFGTPVSQFVKGQAQLVFHQRINKTDWLVSRLAVGVAFAYGNSDNVPYSDQFYVGGANSVRGFNVRSIGPGRYKPPTDELYPAYLDRTGTLKFDFSTEFRFNIWKSLKGAVFIDAGNVWLMKEDEWLPGGKIEFKKFFRDLALGTGAGLRYDMSMLVVRADFGIALHCPYDTGYRGYFNIGKFSEGWAFHLAIGYPF